MQNVVHPKSQTAELTYSETDSLYIPPTQSADALFSFMPMYDYLEDIILNRRVCARYCVEQIDYLELPGITRIAYPMKCFCDINLHKIHSHIDWYGTFGIALCKEWCLKQDIQPIRYINPNSGLRKSLAEAFKSAQSFPISNDEAVEFLRWFPVHSLMYVKPYQGKMWHNSRKGYFDKCLTDECEWRYVIDVSKDSLPQILYEDDMLSSKVMDRLNRALRLKTEYSLNFEYDDVKYIIVNTESEFDRLAESIWALDAVETIVRHKLVGKIIVWETAKGDF